MFTMTTHTQQKELADAAVVDEPLQAKVDNLLVEVQRAKSEMDSAKRKYVKLEDSCKQIKAEVRAQCTDQRCSALCSYVQHQ
jgi:peptidoglycan hydrolase CwlO-like protein